MLNQIRQTEKVIPAHKRIDYGPSCQMQRCLRYAVFMGGHSGKGVTLLTVSRGGAFCVLPALTWVSSHTKIPTS